MWSYMRAVEHRTARITLSDTREREVKERLLALIEVSSYYSRYILPPWLRFQKCFSESEKAFYGSLRKTFQCPRRIQVNPSRAGGQIIFGSSWLLSPSSSASPSASPSSSCSTTSTTLAPYLLNSYSSQVPQPKFWKVNWGTQCIIS